MTHLEKCRWLDRHGVMMRGKKKDEEVKTHRCASGHAQNTSPAILRMTSGKPGSAESGPWLFHLLTGVSISSTTCAF